MIVVVYQLLLARLIALLTNNRALSGRDLIAVAYMKLSCGLTSFAYCVWLCAGVREAKGILRGSVVTYIIMM